MKRLPPLKTFFPLWKKSSKPSSLPWIKCALSAIRSAFVLKIYLKTFTTTIRKSVGKTNTPTTLPFLSHGLISHAVTARKPITSPSWSSGMKRGTAKNLETAVQQSHGATQKRCTICMLRKPKVFPCIPIFLRRGATRWKNTPERRSKSQKTFMKWRGFPCLSFPLFQKADRAAPKLSAWRTKDSCFPMAIIPSFLRKERQPLRAG